jgi:CelD/BcsL family acetyltransferase involved in cellulose biosynthesis
VQFWAVRGGQAIVLKLAHDEAFKAQSPGTVLTALMLRHFLDAEHVARLDFGRGDDAYKQGWAVERRQRIGVLLVNPWRPAGIAALVRHAGGRMRAAASVAIGSPS